MSLPELTRPADPNQRLAWYDASREWEQRFCEVVGPRHGLTCRINPAKTRRPTDIDLEVSDWPTRPADHPPILAELKVMFAPFFTATRYNVDPQWAWTINESDIARSSPVHQYQTRAGTANSPSSHVLDIRRLHNLPMARI